MTTQFYYLSPCARLSAYALTDKHVIESLTSIPRLLSTAAQFITCEQSNNLLPVYSPTEDHVKWLLQSAFNYEWGLSYYNTLVEIGEYVFKLKHSTYKLQNELAKYIILFPNVDPTPMPCLFDEVYFLETTEKSYRNYYKQVEAKAGAHRKMVTPWWVRSSRRLPIVKQSIVWQAPSPDNPFSDLE